MVTLGRGEQAKAHEENLNKQQQKISEKIEFGDKEEITVKNMKVLVTTTQYEGELSNKTELLTNGELTIYSESAKSNRPLYVIRYDDSSQTGYGDTRTVFSIYKNNRAVIERVNPHADESMLVVESGQKHFCSYSLPMGVAEFGVTGKEIDYRINRQGGNVKLGYSLEFNFNVFSTFVVEIKLNKNRR